MLRLEPNKVFVSHHSHTALPLFISHLRGFPFKLEDGLPFATEARSEQALIEAR